MYQEYFKVLVLYQLVIIQVNLTPFCFFLSYVHLHVPKVRPMLILFTTVSKTKKTKQNKMDMVLT